MIWYKLDKSGFIIHRNISTYFPNLKSYWFKHLFWNFLCTLSCYHQVLPCQFGCTTIYILVPSLHKSQIPLFVWSHRNILTSKGILVHRALSSIIIHTYLLWILAIWILRTYSIWLYERVVDRLPLMTYGLKLSLETWILKFKIKYYKIKKSNFSIQTSLKIKCFYYFSFLSSEGCSR